MNWQKHNYKNRLRDDSSWQRSSPTPSRLKPRVGRSRMQADVNEDEEVYTDGTSITNISVAGVKDKIAMFGAKPGVSSKPVPAVLQRFQEKAAEVGQTNFRSFGKPSESSDSSAPAKSPSSTPARTFGSTPAKTFGSTPAKTFGSTPAKTFGSTSVKTTGSSPPSKTFGRPVAEPKTSSGPPSSALKPKTFGVKEPPTQAPWKPKTSETTTDQNQNVTDISFKKRGSLNIPNKFQQKSSTAPSTERKISIEEKPSVQNGSIPKPTSPSSPTSSVSSKPSVKEDDDEDSKPKIDFRANLRPTNKKGAGPPKPIEIHPRQRTPSQDEKPITPPGSKGVTKSPPASKASFSIPKRITPFQKIVTRGDDGKKFERVAKSSIITTELAPIKPLKPRDVSIKDIIEEFKKAYEDFKYANEELYDDVGNFIKEDEGEEYDDVGNTMIAKRESKRKSNRPVSDIPSMTEEEELGSGGSASASGSGGSAAVLGNSQDELYDEGVPGEPEELYEPLPDEEPEVDTPVVDKKEQERKEKEAAEKKKKEEKEQKEREKREKQEQAKREKEEKARLDKERKEKERKEREEKELKKKLKITGEELTEAQGVVKEKSKGGKLDLAVQPGDKVDIMRMTNNPKGKWLVKNQEGTFGYVESDNILIETPTIKQAMQLVDNPPAVGDEGPEEMYEDLDGFQGEMEEIYEECT